MRHAVLRPLAATFVSLLAAGAAAGQERPFLDPEAEEASARSALERWPAQSLLVLRGATLIDGTGAPPRQNATVVVEDGRIVAVGGAEVISPPEGAEVVDLAGRWLLPGFVDAHAPLAGPEGAGRLLAAGITAGRAGTVGAGAAVGAGEPRPRLLSGGAVVEAPGEAAEEAEGVRRAVREAVRRRVSEGAQFLRLSGRLSVEALAAAAIEARRLGVRTVATAGLPGWADAARAGADGVEGLAGPPDDAIRARIRWWAALEPDGELADRVLNGLLARDASVTPLLASLEWSLLCGDSAYAAEALGVGFPAGVRAERMPPAREEATGPPGEGAGNPAVAEAAGRASAPGASGCPPAASDPDLRADAREGLARALRLVGRLHRHDLLLVAGSGPPEAAPPPGAAFHRELELLVEAGLSPVEAIRAATRNGAMALGFLLEAGTVEIGKRADLVALTADPVADVRNARCVAWVLSGDAFYVPSGSACPSGTAPGQ